MVQATTTETLQRTISREISRKLKQNLEKELSRDHATNDSNTGKEVFFSSMLEEILDIRNVQKAFKQVTANKGAGGIDGMQTDELRDYLNANWQTLRKDILEGNYRPQAVRKVEIPKPQGGTRKLGIPKLVSYYVVLQTVLGMFISRLISFK